jgi:hypothetical protein
MKRLKQTCSLYLEVAQLRSQLNRVIALYSLAESRCWSQAKVRSFDLTACIQTWKHRTLIELETEDEVVEWNRKRKQDMSN